VRGGVQKPLPLNLLPYYERNDAYRSVGTAFALGHNTFVTAAHVLTG
jgi:serine protease Do